MTKAAKRGITIAVIAVVLIVVGNYVYNYIKYMPRVIEVEGLITWVDAPNRQASIEFVADWDNERKEKTADVPEGCEILINGKPAALEDIQAGEKAFVRAEYRRREKRLIPQLVKVTRDTADEPTATAPAAQ